MKPINRLAVRLALLAAPAVCAFACLAAAEATLPPMHPGLWQNSMVMNMQMQGDNSPPDMTPTISYSCENAYGLAEQIKMTSGMLSGCTFDLEGGGSTFTITTDCVNPDGQKGSLKGTSTLTLLGTTAIHLTGTSSGNIANMQMNSTDVNDSKWVGDCPAGWVSGDFGKMVNGVLQKDGNFNNMPKMPSAGN